MKKANFAKALALALCVMLALAALSGCEKAADKGGGVESTLTLNGDKIYPIQTDEVLTYWANPSTNWTGQYENFADTPLGKQIAVNTGVTVEYIHPETGQTEEQFNLMLSSSTLPHVVEKNWHTVAGGPETTIAEGYIHELNEYWEKWSPAISKIMNDNPDWARQAKTDSGKYYAYPFIRGVDKLTVGQGPTIRKDFLDKASLSVPETIEEWEVALTAFKDEFGAKKAFSGKDTKNAFMGAFGIWSGFYLEGDTVKYGPYEDGYKDFLETFSSWYAKGLIDPDVATIDAAGLDAGVLNGQIGVFNGWAGSGMGKYMTAKDTAQNIDPDFNLVAAPFPVLQKGQTPEFGHKDNSVLMGNSVAISQNCENVELAARFLDYGYTEEGNILFNFGIEGESFDWVDGYPTYSDSILKNPEGLPIAHALGAYTRACYSGLMVQRVEYIEQYYQIQQQTDALEIWGDTNMKAHLLPDVTIASGESDEYSEKMATIETFVNEMYVRFLTGADPVSNFEQYKQQLTDFGMEKVIKMKQDAYNRYLAR